MPSRSLFKKLFFASSPNTATFGNDIKATMKARALMIRRGRILKSGPKIGREGKALRRR